MPPVRGAGKAMVIGELFFKAIHVCLIYSVNELWLAINQ